MEGEAVEEEEEKEEMESKREANRDDVGKVETDYLCV